MVVSVRLNVYAWVRCALTFYCRICSCCVFCYFWFLVWFGIRSITTRKYSDAKKSIKSPCTFRLVHKTVLRVYYFGFGLLPYLFRSPFLSLYVYTQHINKSVYIVSVCLCVCVCVYYLFHIIGRPVSVAAYAQPLQFYLDIYFFLKNAKGYKRQPSRNSLQCTFIREQTHTHD